MMASYFSKLNNISTDTIFDLILFDNEQFHLSLLQGDVNIDARDFKGNTLLLFACSYRRERIVDLLIKSGANVDCSDEQKYTALHHATQMFWTDIGRSLTKKVSDLDARNSRGDTALHIASRTGNLEMVKCLLEEGADIDPKNILDYTPLICAAQESVKDIFDLLLDSGASADDNKGLLLYYALRNSWEETVQFLVKRMPDLNNRYVMGETDLDTVSRAEDLEIVKWLVKEGIDINTRNNMIVRAAFFEALFSENLEAVKWLVKRVPDLNEGNFCGETALHISSSFGNLEMVKCLVEEGADINTRDGDGKTAFIQACEWGCLEVMKYLFEKGADINIRDRKGQAALHRATSKKYLDVVKYLVEIGADINVKSFDGKTPLLCAACVNCKYLVDLFLDLGTNVDCSFRKITMLHLASIRGWVDIVQYLVKERCDLDARATFGVTALYFACRFENLDTVKFLLQAGATWDIADLSGVSPLNLLTSQQIPDIKLIKLFIENGAYLKPVDYNALVKNSSLEVLQDMKLSHQLIVNKFNNHSLLELYKLPASGILPRIEEMKIARGSEVARAIEQTVQFEIQKKGHCNFLEVRPMALSVFSVVSVLDYYENKKSELQNQSAGFDPIINRYQYLSELISDETAV